MKKALLALVVLTIALVLLLNIRLRSPGDAAMVDAQLRHLEGALSEGAADEMQSLFPEGHVFTWALYGLASAQHALHGEVDAARRGELLFQAYRAVVALRSERARATFDSSLTPAYGAFYNAWSLYTTAVYIRAAGGASVPTEFLRDFSERCDRFARALDEYGSPFLESYPGRVWPADTPPGVAALAIHDAVVERRYADVVRRWVREARARLEPTLGALSHTAEARTGAPGPIARGESLALMSRILVDVDTDFAREQYALLRAHFLDAALGVPGMREYPRHIDGEGDVDSGPIILGFSGPAIVVGAAAARAHGDHDVADGLLGAVELAGMPVQFGSSRCYAVGMLPVGDAFIAWARSTPADKGTAWPQIGKQWYLAFHAFTLITAMLLGWWAVRLVRAPLHESRGR